MEKDNDKDEPETPKSILDIGQTEYTTNRKCEKIDEELPFHEFINKSQKHCGDMEPYFDANKGLLCCKIPGNKKRGGDNTWTKKNYLIWQKKQFIKRTRDNSSFHFVKCDEDMKKLILENTSGEKVTGETKFEAVQYCSMKMNSISDDFVVVGYDSSKILNLKKDALFNLPIDKSEGQLWVYSKIELKQLFESHDKEKEFLPSDSLNQKTLIRFEELKNHSKNEDSKLKGLTDKDIHSIFHDIDLDLPKPQSSQVSLDDTQKLQLFNVLKYSSYRSDYETWLDKNEGSAIFRWICSMLYNRFMQSKLGQWVEYYMPWTVKSVRKIKGAFDWIKSHPYLCSMAVAIASGIKTLGCVYASFNNDIHNWFQVSEKLVMGLLYESLGHLPQSLKVALALCKCTLCVLKSGTQIITGKVSGVIQEIMFGCVRENFTFLGQGFAMFTQMFIGGTSGLVGSTFSVAKDYSGLTPMFDSIFGDGGYVQKIALFTGFKEQQDFDAVTAYSAWNESIGKVSDNYNKVFALHQILNFDRDVLIPLIRFVAPGSIEMIDKIFDLFKQTSKTTYEWGLDVGTRKGFFSKTSGEALKQTANILNFVASTKDNLVALEQEIKKMSIELYQMYLLMIQTVNMIKELSEFICCGLKRSVPMMAPYLSNCGDNCCPKYIENMLTLIHNPDFIIEEKGNGTIIVRRKLLQEAEDASAFN